MLVERKGYGFSEQGEVASYTIKTIQIEII